MAKEVIMPKFGFTQETAQVVAWLKNEGDFVEAGDPIMEVETDKVTMEVEAPATGILSGLRVKAGDTVPVTEIIAYILGEGESLPQSSTQPIVLDAPSSPPAPEAPSKLTEKATPLAARIAMAESVNLGEIVGTGAGGRVTKRDVTHFIEERLKPVAPNGNGSGKVPATPAARRVANQLGVNLRDVSGTGPKGRVQQADVESFAQSLIAEVAAPSAVSQAPLSSSENNIAERIPFTNMRRTIARNLQGSWQQAPHIMFQVDVDVTAAQKLVEYANQSAPEGVKVTLTAVFIKAIAWALRRHPMLNSHLGQDEILVMRDVNIGMAVALDNGLIVPVIRHADRLGIYEIAAEAKRLSLAARAGKLRPDDLANATFTISNLGMYGVDRFTAIINPPQVGILAVGRARPVFVPDERNQPVLRPLVNLTLSVDHRVIDGSVAAQFLTDLGEVLIHLERMML